MDQDHHRFHFYGQPSLSHCCELILLSFLWVGFLHSVLLTPELGRRLANWLPAPPTRLLFRATAVQMQSRPFHQSCDYQGPTVVIVKACESDTIFGGFTNVSWIPAGCRKLSGFTLPRLSALYTKLYRPGSAWASQSGVTLDLADDRGAVLQELREVCERSVEGTGWRRENVPLALRLQENALALSREEDALALSRQETDLTLGQQWDFLPLDRQENALALARRRENLSISVRHAFNCHTPKPIYLVILDIARLIASSKTVHFQSEHFTALGTMLAQENQHQLTERQANVAIANQVYDQTRKSFLFNLTANKRFKLLPGRYEAIEHDMKCGPIFGSGPDLKIVSGFAGAVATTENSSSSHCGSFALPHNSSLSGFANFTVEEYEVFAVRTRS